MNDCFWSLNGVMEKYIQEINNHPKCYFKDWAKTVSVRKTLLQIIFENFSKSLFDGTEKAK